MTKTPTWLLFISILLTIQFLAMLYLIGRIENQLEDIKFDIRAIQRPVRNEVVTVAFKEERRVHKRFFTIFGGNLYEMRRVQ